MNNLEMQFFIVLDLVPYMRQHKRLHIEPRVNLNRVNIHSPMYT